MMRSPWLALCATVVVAVAVDASIGAQTSPSGFRNLPNGLRYRCVHVPGAPGVCATLGIAVGTHHDPAGKTGLAASMGAHLRLLQKSRPASEQLQVEVLGPLTLVTGLRPQADLDALLSAVARTVADEAEITADDAERATGTAALMADEATHVFPGPILRSRAERTLLQGTPDGRQSLGIPAEMRTIDAEYLRSWSRAHFRVDNAALAVVGGLEQGAMDAAVARAFGGLTAGAAPAPAIQLHDALPAADAETETDRVAAPFVSLALRTPSAEHADHAAFLVGMDIARARAARELGSSRGRENAAGLTPLEFDAAGKAPLVSLNRRAPDGASAVIAKNEIVQFLNRLVTDTPSPTATSRAVARVSRRLALAAPAARDAAASQRRPGPAALRLTARGWVFAALRGGNGDLLSQLAAVTPDDVRSALKTWLAPDHRHWFALVPTHRARAAGPARGPAPRR